MASFTASDMASEMASDMAKNAGGQSENREGEGPILVDDRDADNPYHFDNLVEKIDTESAIQKRQVIVAWLAQFERYISTTGSFTSMKREDGNIKWGQITECCEHMNREPSELVKWMKDNNDSSARLVGSDFFINKTNANSEKSLAGWIISYRDFFVKCGQRSCGSYRTVMVKSSPSIFKITCMSCTHEKIINPKTHKETKKN